MLVWLLVAGCEMQVGGSGYHRWPPYVPPIPPKFANCTRRGSADEVWRLFWPTGAAAGIDEFEHQVEGRWTLERTCGEVHEVLQIVVGPSRRSDFGLLNSGCAEVMDGAVPGTEDGRPRDWMISVDRSGALRVGRWPPGRPRSIVLGPRPAPWGVSWVGGRWTDASCEVEARRLGPAEAP